MGMIMTVILCMRETETQFFAQDHRPKIQPKQNDSCMLYSLLVKDIES